MLLGHNAGRRRVRARARISCLTCCGSTVAAILILTGVGIAWFYGTTMRTRVVSPPPHALPSPNGLDDIVLAGQMAKATGGTNKLIRSTSTAYDMAEAEKVVRVNAQVLSIARRALTKECRVPSTRSFTDQYPYLAQARELARLLAAESKVRAHHGDYTGAFESGLDGYALAPTIARGGALIHGLVQVAIDAVSQPALVDNVDKLPAADAQRLCARLESAVRSQVPTSDFMREERDAFLGSIAVIDQGIRGGGPDDLRGLFDTEDAGSSAKLPASLLWRLHHDALVSQQVRYLNALAVEAGKPAANRTNVPAPTDMLARLFAPVMDNALSRFDANNVRMRLVVAALRIHAFRARTGRLPATLNEAGVPTDLQIDAFSGKPFIYRPNGADYLLYSVGPDLRDNGGVPADESEQSPQPDGDYGITAFRKPSQGNPPSRTSYRKVPHMLPPKLAPGDPPLFP